MQADKLVKAYIRIRDARAALKAKYDQEDGELKEELQQLESHILTLCNSTGTDGLRTPYGTASRTVKTRYWTGDWGAMHQFILDNDAPDLLERRIAQAPMKAFLDEHPDKRPVGLNVDQQYAITVRRK
mgnify:CR=1 FL=1